eukprot:GHRR01001002.1.p1 GENE.GHRR01001002.1~~GHRR01001002.1.p1  ORF type:complete len:609 (+),score=236.60 GHRR01001002.1:178-2004(+)
MNYRSQILEIQWHAQVLCSPRIVKHRGPFATRLSHCCAKAAAVHEAATNVVVERWPKQRQVSRATLDVAPAAPEIVEVHFQLKYKCEYGQCLAIVGSPQGWQTSAAVAMTWSDGDVWSAVVTLPLGADIEYKYVVCSGDSQVQRWQEGSNNRLSLNSPGVLLQVTDTWGQNSKQVHEIGLPAAATTARAAVNNSTIQQLARAFSKQSDLRQQPKETSADDSGVAQETVAQQNVAAKQGFGTTAANFAAAGNLSPAVAKTGSSSSVKNNRIENGQLADRIAAVRSDVNNHNNAATLHTFQPSRQQWQQRSWRSSRHVEPSGQQQLQQLGTIIMAAAAPQRQQQWRQHPYNAQQRAQGPSSTPVLQHQQISLVGNECQQGSSTFSSLADASDDELAAALLSDDCEEACFCMVDAFCSCDGLNSSEDYCWIEDHQQPLQSSAAAIAPGAVPDYESYGTSYVTSAAAGAAQTAADHGNNSTGSSSGSGARRGSLEAKRSGYRQSPYASRAAPSSQQPSVSQWRSAQQQRRSGPTSGSAADQNNSNNSNSSATNCKEGSYQDDAAAVYAGVREALAASAHLLQKMADVSHPLVLEADRNVARAQRGIGRLLPA